MPELSYFCKQINLNIRMNKYCTIAMFLIALSSNPTSSLAQYEWQEGADTANKALAMDWNTDWRLLDLSRTKRLRFG